MLSYPESEFRRWAMRNCTAAFPLPKGRIGKRCACPTIPQSALENYFDLAPLDFQICRMDLSLRKSGRYPALVATQYYDLLSVETEAKTSPVAVRLFREVIS
jgi:hypothetical protein